MENFTDNALRILQERYLWRKGNGEELEPPEEMLRRVAKYVAQAELKWSGKAEAEKWESFFFDMMSTLVFLPNSPTLMNAGLPKSQLSACFVLPVKDNHSGIFDSLKLAALVHQKGGGTGFNFSRLRPAGDPLGFQGGHASGPVSFIKLFDFATEQVKQGGKRRGANMGILNVDHPDILEFIRLKVNGKALQNFNLSVGIFDRFMEAVTEGRDWQLIHPNSRKVVQTLPAKEIWEAILEGVWENGNPGMVFLDTIHAANPLSKIGRIWATNPCGEVPLLDYESCNLGSVNLSRFVSNGKVDYQKLKETVRTGIRFLDNVIEVNHYPIIKIEKATLSNRKIGLGVMGWAEMLLRFQIPYDTEEAVHLGDQVMSFICRVSQEASHELAFERGCFPNWEVSAFNPQKVMRNATVTSIAPTGTISILADTSSSIEPLFALAFQRKKVLNSGSLTTEVHPLFKKAVEEGGFPVQEILAEVRVSGRCGYIADLPYQLRSVFKTALEIQPEWHLKHQLIFQKHTDNAVSKTVNLPETASPKNIGRIYCESWKNKAKGITVFRNNSGNEQVIYQGIGKSCKV
jgi:ribonucleoside-diphosphate reductase alpha chain